MNYRNLSHFLLGIKDTLGRGKADIHSLLEAENVRINAGEIRLRKGQKYIHDELEDVTGDINAVYMYARAWWNIDHIDTYYEYIFAIGTTLYGMEVGADTSETLNDDYPLATDDVWIAIYNDWAYIGDGENSLKKYDAIDYFPVGIDAPVSAPEVAISPVALNKATDISQSFRKYKYRYVRKVNDDDIDNIVDYVASPFSEATMSPDFQMKQMRVTVVASDDPQVTNIQIYATLAYPSLEELIDKPYYLLDNGDIGYGIKNIDTDYYDDISNISLTNESDDHPPEDTSEDWTNPPDGLRYLIIYKDRLYGVEPIANPSVLRYSEIGWAEKWPSGNWIDIHRDDGDVITGLAIRGGALYIFKNRSVWILNGDPATIPLLQVKMGGDSVGTQTELGIGCTSPRSIAVYKDDTVIFYNKYYGVYRIEQGVIVPISRGYGAILGLDAAAGVIWQDSDGEAFYGLSTASGNAHICHLDSGAWVSDSNVNVTCWCVNYEGSVLGGKGAYINRYYHPDYDTDNGDEYTGMVKTTWVNLRDAEQHAVLRKVQVQSDGLDDACVMSIENQDSKDYTTTFSGDNAKVGIGGLAGRLFTITLRWLHGTVESMTMFFVRRRGH